jgi:hypothetical protein
MCAVMISGGMAIWLERRRQNEPEDRQVENERTLDEPGHAKVSNKDDNNVDVQ